MAVFNNWFTKLMKLNQQLLQIGTGQLRDTAGCCCLHGFSLPSTSSFPSQQLALLKSGDCGPNIRHRSKNLAQRSEPFPTVALTSVHEIYLNLWNSVCFCLCIWTWLIYWPPPQTQGVDGRLANMQCVPVFQAAPISDVSTLPLGLGCQLQHQGLG